MLVVLANQYVRLTVDAERLLVHYVRSSAPYPTLGILEQQHDQVSAALDRLGRHRHVALLDLREAPLSNDPAFERVMARCRPKILRGFARVAVITRTVSGSLQVNRHFREDGVENAQAFLDEPSALAFLGDVKPAPPSNTAPASGVVEVFGSSSRLRPRGQNNR
jgi:hypothetical protein